MICKTLKEVARILVINMSDRRDSVISVNVMPQVFGEGSVLQMVYETDPRLILCIENMQVQAEYYGMWATMVVHITYTDNWCASITKVDSVSDFFKAAYYAARLHRRNFSIVYPIHMYEAIQKEGKRMLEAHQFLNCFVSGFSLETKRIDGCGYMAQIIHFKYSCSYREWMHRKHEVSIKINEIVNYAKLSGIEDWKRLMQLSGIV